MVLHYRQPIDGLGETRDERKILMSTLLKTFKKLDPFLLQCVTRFPSIRIDRHPER